MNTRERVKSGLEGFMGEVRAGMEKKPCRTPYFTRDLSETKKAWRF